MYGLYLIFLVLSPSILALPDLTYEDGYEYNWRLKEYEPYHRPTWRARRTRVEGFPHYESRYQDYLSNIMAAPLQQPVQGPFGLHGGEASSDDELLPPPPPPRHRPQYKPLPASPQFTYHKIHRPLDGPQFAVQPSDSRFFDGFDEKPSIPTVKLTDTEASDGNRIEEETTEEYTQVFKTPLIDFDTTKENIIMIALVVGSSIAAVSGVALLIYGFIRLQKNAKAAADVEYPAYGVTGPNKESTPTGDRRLAHSAQMYHYQLTKQQIIAMESTRGGERRGSISEADSDDENEEGDYTVYECPGLAPTGEMEVKNPLFQDDPTPAITTTIINDQQPEQHPSAAATTTTATTDGETKPQPSEKDSQ